MCALCCHANLFVTIYWNSFSASSSQNTPSAAHTAPILKYLLFILRLKLKAFYFVESWTGKRACYSALLYYQSTHIARKAGRENNLLGLPLHRKLFRTLKIDSSSILLIEYQTADRTPEASCNENCIIIAGEPIHYNNFIWWRGNKSIVCRNIFSIA